MHRMKISTGLIVGLLASSAMAQTPTPSPPAPSLQQRLLAMAGPIDSVWTSAQTETMRRIRDAAMKDDYAYARLTYLSDVIGARPGGSSQAQATVSYIAEQMRALGATVRLEPTTASHWVRGVETAALTNWAGMPGGASQKIIVTALGNSTATSPSGLLAPVIVVDSFAALRALPTGAVSGKIVLFNYPFDKDLVSNGLGIEAYSKSAVYRVVGPAIASKMGAAAVLVRTVADADYRMPHTGAALFPDGLKPLPVAAITAEDAELIARLSRRGSVSMRLVLTPSTLPPIHSFNVIADWPGSQAPQEVVLVSGHLDSWDLGTGALDDAAGLVIAMETIRLMKTLNVHPKRTIRFVGWMDEEMGSPGARTYLQDPENAAIDHVAVLETDRGADRSEGILFSGSPKLGEYLAPVSEVLNPIGASLAVADTEIGEDVSGLMARGTPGFAPAQDLRTYFRYHHSAADTLDKVDAKQLAQSAAVNAVAAYALADAPVRPPKQ